MKKDWKITKLDEKEWIRPNKLKLMKNTEKTSF